MGDTFVIWPPVFEQRGNHPYDLPVVCCWRKTRITTRRLLVLQVTQATRAESFVWADCETSARHLRDLARPCPENLFRVRSNARVVYSTCSKRDLQ